MNVYNTAIDYRPEAIMFIIVIALLGVLLYFKKNLSSQIVIPKYDNPQITSSWVPYDQLKQGYVTTATTNYNEVPIENNLNIDYTVNEKQVDPVVITASTNVDENIKRIREMKNG